MNLIDTDMRLVVESARLSFVATVEPDGSPHLSPKASLRVYDDTHLVFMDIASPQTISNLAAGSRIAINSIDFLRRRGYRFNGTAELRGPGDPAYEWLHDWLVGANGPGYPAHQAVFVHVDQASPILSPAYTFGADDEQHLVAQWSAQYGIGSKSASENSAP